MSNYDRHSSVSEMLHVLQWSILQERRNVQSLSILVTGPEKTGLIYTKYTHSHFAAYLFFCVCYSISVSYIEFCRIFCIYDEMCVEMLCCYNEILHLKD